MNDSDKDSTKGIIFEIARILKEAKLTIEDNRIKTKLLRDSSINL